MTKEQSPIAAALMMIPGLVHKKVAIQKWYADTHPGCSAHEMHTIYTDIGPMNHEQLQMYIDAHVSNWSFVVPTYADLP
jgi:hypothetical protein